MRIWCEDLRRGGEKKEKRKRNKLYFFSLVLFELITDIRIYILQKYINISKIVTRTSCRVGLAAPRCSWFRLAVLNLPTLVDAKDSSVLSSGESTKYVITSSRDKIPVIRATDVAGHKAFAATTISRNERVEVRRAQVRPGKGDGVVRKG